MDVKLFTDVPLQVPLEQGEGKPPLTTLRIRRPKTRHVKQAVLALGPDVVKRLLDGFEAGEDGKVVVGEADAGALFAEMVRPQVLDGLSGIIADLAGLSESQVDEIDPLDIGPVVGAALGFFSELLSLPGETQSST